MGCSNKAKEPSVFYYLPIGKGMNLSILPYLPAMGKYWVITERLNDITQNNFYKYVF